MLKKIILIATIFLIVGCGSQPTLSASDALATIVSETMSAMQLTPNQPASTIATPEGGIMANPALEGVVLTAGQVPQGTGLFVYSTITNLSLRSGPGKLFDLIVPLPKDAQLEVLGNSANQWLMVKDADGSVGWVDRKLVAGGFDGSVSIPTFIPADSFTISGVVSGPNGPMTYVGISLRQGEEFSDENFTNDTGNFYFYVPKSITGDWFVEEYSVDCRSNLMDANCVCISKPCGSIFPASSKITFPLTSDTIYMNLGWQ